MDFLITYIFTILVSYTIDFFTLTDIMKVIYDNGYKMALDSDISFHDSKEINKFIKIIKFIPLLNLVDSLMTRVSALSTETIIDRLMLTGILEEMNENELKKYKMKPSFFTALGISIDSKKNSKSSSITRLKDGSCVYSKFVEGKLHIDTTGPISELKNEEQISLIIEEMSNSNEFSPLKEMLIEEEIIPKKSKLVLKLENLKKELQAHIEKIETEEQKEKDVQKIKKL